MHKFNFFARIEVYQISAVLYNTPQYNTDLDITHILDITQSCCGYQNIFTVEFYEGIIGK